MASANSTLPSSSSLRTFWSREAPSIKQGVKTGLAGTIAYAIYAGFDLRQGYWAVFAALVVTQANLGASWRAALYRTIGSTCGAIAAALLVPSLGRGPIGVGLALLLLGSLFGYLSALHTAFTAAGFTAALILVFGGQGEPWHFAWLRVLYTIMGALIAFAVGALLWPVRARAALRQKIASIIDGAAVLYRAIAAAALQGVNNQEEVRQLDRKLHDLRRGITQQMDEARSELAFSRFNASAYSRIVELSDLTRRRLTAMAEDQWLYIHAQVEPDLVPSLPQLVQKTDQLFAEIAAAVRNPQQSVDSSGLEDVLQALDADLAKLREQRVTAPFAMDRMLPFWALVFNLREVADDLKQLQSALPQLG